MYNYEIKKGGVVQLLSVCINRRVSRYEGSRKIGINQMVYSLRIAI
jgi:hypothetical protein